MEDIIPGEVDVKKALFVMQLKKGSVSHWRRVIKTTYPTVIIGAQKRDKFIPGASGRGIRQQQIRVILYCVLLELDGMQGPSNLPLLIVWYNWSSRFVVYWKPAGAEGAGAPVKVNLILYENELLQVQSSTGFYCCAACTEVCRFPAPGSFSGRWTIMLRSRGEWTTQ